MSESAPITLNKYLTDLSSDSAALKTFQADPAAALKASGLPEAEQKAVLSRDPNKVRAALKLHTVGESSDGDPIIIIIILAHHQE